MWRNLVYNIYAKCNFSSIIYQRLSQNEVSVSFSYQLSCQNVGSMSLHIGLQCEFYIIVHVNQTFTSFRLRGLNFYISVYANLQCQFSFVHCIELFAMISRGDSYAT